MLKGGEEKKLKERTRGGGGGEETEAKKHIEREEDYVLKGKMSLINYSACREKKQGEILSPRCPFTTSDKLSSRDREKRQGKTENSPKGWSDLQLRPISRQKLSFPPNNSSA